MKPHELIALLLARTDKSVLQVAKEMGRASYQPTLYKFKEGLVGSPTHKTAARIAKYFNLPIEALFDDGVATRVAVERGLASGAVQAMERIPPWPAPELPVFSSELERRMRALAPDQRRGLVSVVQAYLDAVSPAASKPGKQAAS